MISKKTFLLVFISLFLISILLLVNADTNVVTIKTTAATTTTATCLYAGGDTACTATSSGDSASCSIAGQCAKEGQIICSVASQCENGTSTVGPIIAKTVNWDANKTDCECVGGAFLGTTGPCCGDDTTDCGSLQSSNQYICSIGTPNKWWSASTNKGQILDISCNDINTEYLTDGTQWSSCGGTTNPFTIKKVTFSTSTRAFICSANKIIECCGSESCLSPGASVDHKADVGDSYNIGTTAYYCTSDFNWTSNLDSNKGACEARGFNWTGTKCCGDDGAESYNDAGGTGACWQGVKINNKNFIPGTNQTIVSNGTFYGCNLGLTPISSKSYCSIKETYFCSYTNIWKQGATRTTASISPWDGTECCAPTNCWNATGCVSNNTVENHNNKYYYCSDSSWSETVLKYNWDSTASGFCPSLNQCFTTSGCKADGYYSDNHYCENGTWTTRTKILALQMLDIATKANPNSYTLFCDNYGGLQGAFNNPDYSAFVTGYFEDSKACVLRYKNLAGQEHVILGASLESSVTAENLPYIIHALTTIDNVNCNFNNDGQFYVCEDTEGKIWYNHKTKSLLFSAETISITGVTYFQQLFLQFLKNPFGTIFEMIINFHPTGGAGEPISYNFLRNIGKFDNIYLAKEGTREVRGIIEQVAGNKSLSVTYSCFTTNICNSIDNYNNNQFYINCENKSSSYYVMMKPDPNGGGSVNSVFTIWKDLTAKLRLTDTTISGLSPLESCSSLGKTCGSWSNCRGGTLNCGTCLSGQTCINGACVANTCVPATCISLGKTCGSWSDLCGGTLDCGSQTTICTSTFGSCVVSGTKTCSSGQYGTCSATDPRTANCVGKECGSDGCGGSCGICLTGKECVNNICQTIVLPKLECAIKTNTYPCFYSYSGSNVFSMSALTNAHAGGNVGYPYNVCCRVSGYPLSGYEIIPGNNPPVNGEFVISSTGHSNAHVSSTENYYSTNYYLNSSLPISCGEINSGTCENAGYDTCIASISADTNAHIADCTTQNGYDKKICCEVGSPGGTHCNTNSDCPILQCIRAPCPSYSCVNSICTLNP